jgi:hypothetical protein
MQRIPAALALAFGTAIAAPAFAETVTYYLWDPVTRSYVERAIERPDPAYIPPAPAPSITYDTPPATGTVYSAPDIVVTAPRSEDRRINDEVVERIATHPHISGRIGVETWRNDVTLTGRTTTPGQSRLAELEAKSVPGVDEVENLIQPRVGGSY